MTYILSCLSVSMNTEMDKRVYFFAHVNCGSLEIVGLTRFAKSFNMELIRYWTRKRAKNKANMIFLETLISVITGICTPIKMTNWSRHKDPNKY